RSSGSDGDGAQLGQREQVLMADRQVDREEDPGPRPLDPHRALERVGEALQLPVAGVWIGVLEQPAEAEVAAEPAAIAEVEAGEVAEGVGLEHELVAWPRIEVLPAIGEARIEKRPLRARQARATQQAQA